MKRETTHTLSTGLALFSMFFGAGNVTFPLLVGHEAGSLNGIAMLGLCLTAVVLPIFGLASMLLFKCDYRAFFLRLGKIPGYAMILLSMAILGPFLGIPRTMNVAYETLSYQLPQFPLVLFSAIFCFLSYLCTHKKRKVVDIIGIYLTPLLLFLLLVIIGAAILNPLPATVNTSSHLDIFLMGVTEGYNTCDLIAALFFASMIMMNIREKMPESSAQSEKKLAAHCMKAGLIGGALLAFVYVGISFASSTHGAHLDMTTMNPAQLLAALTDTILGSQATTLATLVVFLACFTTAITLVAVTSDFIQQWLVSKEKAANYNLILISVILVSFFMSLLGFSGLMRLIGPVILISYPVFIVLSLGNAAYKLKNIETIKPIAALTLLLSLGAYFPVLN